TLGTVMIPFVLAFRTVAGTIIDNVAWLALLSVTGVIGFFVLCKRWLGSAAILASYLALVVLWTWAVERFLTPVAPLLYLTMLMGAVGIAERFAPRWRRATLLGTGALLVLGPLFESSALIGARVSCDRQHPDVSPGCYTEDERIFLQIAEWVRDSTPPNAVVMTNKDAAFFTHSDRLVINQFRALEEDSASIIPYLRKRGVSYVVVGPIGVRIINHGHLLAKACRDLVVVREFPKASSVLRVRGADEEYDSRNACQALEPWTRLKLPNRQ
ncbi:MAG: hypothetical protein ABIT38_09915, partial [Gemmatimonadaceae bacterium]